MQAYATLVRRELGTYFVSFTGYFIIAAVLLLLGLSLGDVLDKLNQQATDVPITQMFYSTYYFWLILLLTAPVMTMRTFALEKFSGTFETLMTAPVSDLQVVLAKFTGAFLFYLLTWVPLVVGLFVVRHYANEPGVLDLGAMGAGFLGVALIGALYMAMGCFASALTRSQMIAAMISYGLGLALFLIGLRSLMALPPGLSAKVFNHLSMVEHMETFSRGVVDSRALVFYVTMTAFFLFLTLKVVESRRWK